jgi:hypothetical protein
VPGPLDWPFDSITHLSEGNISKAVEGILGDDQLAVFRATKPKVRDGIGLMEAISTATGSGSLGN